MKKIDWNEIVYKDLTDADADLTRGQTTRLIFYSMVGMFTCTWVTLGLIWKLLDKVVDFTLKKIGKESDKTSEEDE